MISVVDARQMIMDGPTLVPVRKLAVLKADAKQAGKAKLTATMICKLVHLLIQLLHLA